MIKQFRKERLAIFDVDGTLFDGNLGIEFLKALIEKGIISKKISKDIFSWYGRYKNDEVDKSIAVDEIYRLFAKAMEGKKEPAVKMVAEETWNKVSDKLYPFVGFLVESLRMQGLRIVLLSGSPIEMVAILGRELKIGKREVIAGKLKVKNGIYTGKIVSYPGSSEAKIQAIKKYLRNMNLDIDFRHSIGMGNNERDLEILNQVGMHFAFEPNSVLRARAKTAKFSIVNRNNVISNVLEKI
jgi:HAD superfamily hydrolase (TIGR01490 family)